MYAGQRYRNLIESKVCHSFFSFSTIKIGDIGSADITSAQDYYPFGWTMPGRKYNPGDYRYGFNGMEKDDEVKGTGSFINYKARMQDTRIARFLSVDPLTSKYPHYSPYQFAGNTPIQAIDLDGLEELRRTTFFSDGEHYKTELTIVSWAGADKGIAIIHDSNINHDTYTGQTSAEYLGSFSGPFNSMFAPEERSALPSGTPQRQAGGNRTFSIGESSGGISFGFYDTPPNNSSLGDVQTGARGQNDFQPSQRTLIITLNPNVSGPNLQKGINAVPEDYEKRGGGCGRRSTW